MSTPPAGRATGGPTVGPPVLLLHRVLLAALAALLLLLAAASLRWPFSWDHGIFAWIGHAILDGGLPYRDAWDVKGPLTFYVFALTEWLAGPAMWGVRVADLVWLAAAALAAGGIVRRLGGSGAAAYTALVLGVQYIGTGYFETAQPDGWAGFILLLGLVPLVRAEDRTSTRTLALSAAVLGTAVLLKPAYGVFAAVPAAYVLLAGDLNGGAKLRSLAIAAGAFALPGLACALWFAAHGALDSLYDTYVLFNLRQSQVPLPGLDTSLAGALQRFSARLTGTPALPAMAVPAVAGMVLLGRTRPRAMAVLALATLGSLFVVYIQQRYWNRYQWHPAYMTLLVLAGSGLGALWHGGGSGRARAGTRMLAVGLGLVLLATLLPEPLREARRWAELRLGRLSPAAYDAEFRHDRVSWDIADARALAGFLRRHTAPDERVLIWSDPMVNYLSGRASIGRFAFHVPVSALALTAQHRRFREEFLRDLARARPAYVAVGRRHLEVADSMNEANIAHRFPELRERILADYAEVSRFGDMLVFRRREATPAGR